MGKAPRLQGRCAWAHLVHDQFSVNLSILGNELRTHLIRDHGVRVITRGCGARAAKLLAAPPPPLTQPRVSSIFEDDSFLKTIN